MYAQGYLNGQLVKLTFQWYNLCQREAAEGHQIYVREEVVCFKKVDFILWRPGYGGEFTGSRNFVSNRVALFCFVSCSLKNEFNRPIFLSEEITLLLLPCQDSHILSNH